VKDSRAYCKDEKRGNSAMVKDLDRETLKRLYVKEKRSTRAIAHMAGCSPTKVRYRCIKYGIKLRANTWNRKIHLKKSVLMRLYVTEKKSLRKVAEMLSCSSETVIKRCKEQGIPLRSQRIEGLTKSLLRQCYLKEGKTTREIAKDMGCSANLIRIKCKKFGIPLRNPGTKKIEIDEPRLRKLYLTQGKCMHEIAELLNCSPGVISRRIKKLDIKR
jgi:DNA-binding Lrp family transcriptional regulator